MPITLDELGKHQKEYGISNLLLLTREEYTEAVKKEAFFYRHHNGIRHTLSDEMLAINKEQADILIKYLKKLRDQMCD